MKISRDGKIIELTAEERRLAYEEERAEIWRNEVEAAIDRSEDNLRFGSEMTREEFAGECIEEIGEELFGEALIEAKFDEIVFDTAESMDVWHDNDDEYDEEECDCE